MYFLSNRTVLVCTKQNLLKSALSRISNFFRKYFLMTCPEASATLLATWPKRSSSESKGRASTPLEKWEEEAIRKVGCGRDSESFEKLRMGYLGIGKGGFWKERGVGVALERHCWESIAGKRHTGVLQLQKLENSEERHRKTKEKPNSAVYFFFFSFSNPCVPR